MTNLQIIIRGTKCIQISVPWYTHSLTYLSIYLTITDSCRDDALARVQEQLGEEIYQAEKDRTEMERVREELYLEEQEEAARQKERDEFGKLC